MIVIIYLIKKIPMHHLEEYLKDLQQIEEKYDKAFARLKYNSIIIYSLWMIIASIVIYSFSS